MKPVLTWILIADGSRARVLENHGPKRGASEVGGLRFETVVPRTHDLMTDRLPRSSESANPARHAIEPHSDPREALKTEHLEKVAAVVDEKAAAAGVDRLIVVAPPHALGVLREVLPHRLKALVTGEVAKDLTKVPDGELAAHLGDVILL